ncbi:DUF6383 domain-containing protein [Massilibacteroides sp.]|uniref:DUF6383 domain-containing protein n=1 Tax=Massilibacteroides sp. TaxID=2034766 RepID=UPI002616F1B5|nr:DUF6383 domain-containing protein [Massilibacteroides sp.]MDD4516269.1 DUF6383 domain-containing protein [Massilibacteroides sp.]
MKKIFYAFLSILLFVSGGRLTAQTYNSQDLSKLKTFMEEPSGGKRNIDMLWAGAPAALDVDGANWVLDIATYVKWNGDRLSRIEAKKKGLSGKLDLSGCAGLSCVYLGDNSLTEVDFKGCTNLEYVYLCINQITSINIQDCYNLKEFMASSSQYTTLDISNRKKLFNLHIPNNKQLTSLKVEGCSALKLLNFTKGSVRDLDLTGCGNLTKLECYGNQITALDLSKTPVITTLEISGTDALGTYTNPLTSLNVSGCQRLPSYDFSSFADLKELDISNCGLSSFDFNKYKKLITINAGGQQLAIGEQIAQEATLKVEVLKLKDIRVTPSDNGVFSEGFVIWEKLPAGNDTYSYDFTTPLPEGVSGTPFGGTVSIPWYNSTAVANEEIEISSHTLFSSEGKLYIQTVSPQTVRIITLTGQIAKQLASVSKASVNLPKGIYIVQFGDNTVKKVIVR